ncbi:MULTISPECIES: PepSY domain-containing protein [unclassified Psychrobacter]|uniref:PepSY domain-containing protein n=1 Tax=unclassified Psychrobacter TaxID=196806 RepID=UPI0018CCCBCE|nr:PepSY domain-containing protein [Psychrobacter sp. SZ93C1]MBH0065593.1 PepSY domain-containing protein [Psychrobacter sp. SZ93C1]
MGKLSKKMQLTTLGAGLAVALTAGVMSTTAIAAQTNLSTEVKAAKGNKVGLKQAITIATKNASGMLISADYDEDDDDTENGVYEIEFSTASDSYEVIVDAITGEVVSTDTERLGRDDINDYNVQRRVKVNVMSAIGIAEKKIGGMTLEVEFEADRDYSDHPLYYKVDLLKGDEVVGINIDANTGETFANKYKR